MSKALEDFTAQHRQRAREGKVEALDPDEDTWEEVLGDGRSSRHQVLAIQFIDEKKRIRSFPYGAFVGSEGVFNGTSHTFGFFHGETMWEVVLEGPETALQAVVDRILEGKRISARWNGSSITAITIRPMKKPASGASAAG